MSEQLDIFNGEEFPKLKETIIPTNDCVNLEKNWYKLSHNGLCILDQFYRGVTGMSGKQASPFLINIHHRCYEGYYEFYQMEYDQIYKDYTEMIYSDKLSEQEINKKYGEEIKQLTTI